MGFGGRGRLVCVRLGLPVLVFALFLRLFTDVEAVVAPIDDDVMDLRVLAAERRRQQRHAGPLARLERAELVRDAQNLRRPARQPRHSGLLVQPGLDQLADVLERFGRLFQPAGREAPPHAGLLERLDRTQALVAILPGQCIGPLGVERPLVPVAPVGRLVVGLAAELLRLELVLPRLVGQLEAEDDRRMRGLEPLGHAVRLAPADDHEPQRELVGQVQRAVDLVGALGFEKDRPARTPQRRQHREVFIDRDGRLRVSPGVGAHLRVPVGIEHRLPQQRGDAQRRARVGAPLADLTSRRCGERRREGQRPGDEAVPQGPVAGRHDRRPAGEHRPRRHQQGRGEAGLAGGREVIAVRVDQPPDAPPGEDPPAQGPRHADPRLVGDRLHVALDPAFVVLVEGRRLDAPAGEAVHEAGIRDVAAAVDDQRPGRDRGVAADGDDPPVADHDRRVLDRLPRPDDGGHVADGHRAVEPRHGRSAGSRQQCPETGNDKRGLAHGAILTAVGSARRSGGSVTRAGTAATGLRTAAGIE